MSSAGLDFPSGSKWGKTQLEALKFSLQPETHDFVDFSCGRKITSKNEAVLAKLRVCFGVDENEWGVIEKLPDGTSHFYEELADMLPRLRRLQNTPQRPGTRSTLNLPSSSVKTASSPWSIDNTKDYALVSDHCTPTKSRVTAEMATPIPSVRTPLRASYAAIIPRTPENYGADEDGGFSPVKAAKRKRESSTQSPSLPSRPFTRTKPQETLAVGSEDMPKSQTPEPPSSQTDSTFRSSDAVPESEDDETDGDRPEEDVNIVIRNMLKIICGEHNRLHGTVFTAGNLVDNLIVPICGDFPRTRPDLNVQFYRDRKDSLTLLDLELKRRRMTMSKEGKFGQEVAHLLGRANAMNATKTADHYDVFLVTAHNMDISIVACRVSAKYLHRLQSDLPRSSAHTPVVHRYGPVDILNTKQRVEAVCTIYKLMLDQWAALSKCKE